MGQMFVNRVHGEQTLIGNLLRRMARLVEFKSHLAGVFLRNGRWCIGRDNGDGSLNVVLVHIFIDDFQQLGAIFRGAYLAEIRDCYKVGRGTWQKVAHADESLLMQDGIDRQSERFTLLVAPVAQPLIKHRIFDVGRDFHTGCTSLAALTLAPTFGSSFCRGLQNGVFLVLEIRQGAETMLCSEGEQLKFGRVDLTCFSKSVLETALYLLIVGFGGGLFEQSSKHFFECLVKILCPVNDKLQE